MTDDPRVSEPGQPDISDLDRPGPAMLRWAYAQGIFPMAEPDGSAIGWYAPEQRGVIPLEAFRVPRRVIRQARSGVFDLRTNTAFESVMRACAAPRMGPATARDQADSRGSGDLPDAPVPPAPPAPPIPPVPVSPDDPDDSGHPDHPDDGTWINDTLIAAYVALHEQGAAHSIEAWRDGVLVGGLYGVHLGAAFMGESMFIRPELGGTGASKVCLAMLRTVLQRGGFLLLDTQFTTSHLARFGGREIPAAEYNRQLEVALGKDGVWPANLARAEFEFQPVA